MTTLRIFVPATLDATHDQYEWVMFGSQRELLRAGMDSIAQLPACNMTEVIVPGQLVSYVQITAPKVSDKKLIEILPFMIEDSLLTPPEDIHTVITQRHNSLVTVAIIQKSWLQQLIQALASYHLNPKRIMPDFLLLPHVADTWVIAQKDNTLIVNTGPAQGFALTLADTAPDAVINLLNMALTQAEPAARPQQLLINGEDLFSNLRLWQPPFNIRISQTNTSWKLNTAPVSFNFMQHAFAPQSNLLQGLLKFRPALLTIAVIAVLQFVLMSIDYAVKSQRSRQLDHEMVQLFKSTFPEATTIVDAPLQMHRKLEDMKFTSGELVNNDFIPLLALISKSLGGLSAEKLTALDYQHGRLTLSIRAENAALLEAMRQKLLLAGLAATLENSRTVGTTTEAQLVIEPQQGEFK